MLLIIDTLEKLATIPKENLGLVATMGNLHQGHASLLKRSRLENQATLLSIFVNPTQFNDAGDYTRYPRTLEADLQMAKALGVDYVFLPDENMLYPNGYRYRIYENQLATIMEGKYRPQHFDGMLTVVMKLLQLTQPTNAYFGEKDYQQYQLIQGMARDFFLRSQIIPCETIREDSGLAFSSRNNLLSSERRLFAAQFYQALRLKQDCVAIRHHLEQLDFKVDYIEEHEGRRYGAIFVDQVRLIDNVLLCPSQVENKF